MGRKNKKQLSLIESSEKISTTESAPSNSEIPIPEIEFTEKVVELKIRVRIAISRKPFSHISNYTLVHNVRNIKSWRQNQIIRDEKEIDFLLSISAPIEVYYRDV